LNEQELRQRIEESEVKELIEALARSSMPRFPLDSPEAQERYKQDLEHAFRNCVLEYAHEIGTSLGAFGGSYSTLLSTTLEVHKKTFISLNFASLKTNSQEISQEIEKLKRAKPLLSRLINLEAKKQFDNTRMVTIERSNSVSSESIDDWQKYESKIKGQEAVLDLAILFYEQILAVYTQEIAERQRSPKIRELISNMTKLVNDAEKIRRYITTANEKAQKAIAQGTQPDLKTCKTYIEETIEFNDLLTKYLDLKSQLDFYTNDTSNVASFPALSSDETSADHQIKTIWRRYA
jgi:hypothetical protein